MSEIMLDNAIQASEHNFCETPWAAEKPEWADASPADSGLGEMHMNTDIFRQLISLGVALLIALLVCKHAGTIVVRTNIAQGSAQPDSAPNGGPAPSLTNSVVLEGPPSGS